MDTSTFEHYLMEVHAKDYQGTDDDMLDNFHAWLEQLDGNEIIELAEKFGVELNEKLRLKK